LIGDDYRSAADPHASDMAKPTLKRQMLKGVLWRTIALMIFVVAAVAFFRQTMFFLPSVSSAAVLYVASIMKIALSGRLSRPIRSSANAVAITIFCSLLITAPELPTPARSLGLSCFLLGAIWAVHLTSKAYSELTSVATRALLIAAAGYLYYSLFSASNIAILPRLSTIALIGFAAAAIFSFIGILSRHSNALVSSISSEFARISNSAKAGAAVTVILTYMAFIRPSLLKLGSMWLTVIEWMAMCTVLYLLFRKIKSLTTADDAMEFGTGRSVAGLLSHDKKGLKRAAMNVEEFVNCGKKDGLIVITAETLIDNGIDADQVQEVISIIVGYQEPTKPPLMFRWTAGDTDKAQRRMRLKALARLMDALRSTVEASGFQDTGDKSRAEQVQ